MASNPPSQQGLQLEQTIEGQRPRAYFSNYYKKIIPLSSHVHQSLKLQPQENYKTFQKANILPVTLKEFGQVCLTYPIVFSHQQPSTAMAMLSVTPHQNHFVTRGYWQKESYIPSVARRYPFIAVAQESTQEYLLCFDELAPQMSYDQGQPLFQGKEPTELTKSLLKFCVDFDKNIEATQEFTQALDEADLLVEHEIQLKSSTGRQIFARGFKTIDHLKFKSLSDVQILAWHKKGWIEAIHYVLLSQNHWQTLADQSVQDRNFLEAV